MAKCFGMAKDSMWTWAEDKNKKKDDPTCFVLRHSDFIDMYTTGRCGTPKCPFFKERRKEVR